MENAMMESGHDDHSHDHHRHSGDFKGHAGPGTAFIVYGCLWTYNSLFRYHVARRQAALNGDGNKKLNYKNSLFSMYHSHWAQRAPFEAVIGFSIITVISLGEIVQYYFGQPMTVTVHHIQMYFFYGVMSALHILRYYRSVIPPSLEYVAFILANAVSAFILSNHLFGRSLVDAQMHKIVIYLNIIQIICLGLEITYSRSVTTALARTVMFIAQGIWLWMMAIVIYPPPFVRKYDLDDHTVLSIISSSAVVPIASALTIALLMNVHVDRRVRNMNSGTVNYIVGMTNRKLRVASTKGEDGSPFITDSDPDV